MKKIKRSKANEGRSWKGKKKCTHCGGSGYHGDMICPECKGSGFVSKKHKPKSDYGGQMFKAENWLPDQYEQYLCMLYMPTV